MRYIFICLVIFIACNTDGGDTPEPDNNEAFSLTEEEICSLEFDATAPFDASTLYATWIQQKQVKCFVDSTDIAYDLDTDQFEHHHEFEEGTDAWNVHTFEKSMPDTLDVLDGVFFDSNVLPKFNYVILEDGQPRVFPETGEILKIMGDNALFIWQPCAQYDFCGEYQVYLFKKQQ